MVAPIPIAWATIEDALHDWFESATGLTSKIRWADQAEPRPAYPYGTLKIIAGPTEVGTRDSLVETTDLTRTFDTKVTPLARNTTTYTVTINGTLFMFVSDADATVAEITAGLVAAIAGGAEPVTATDNVTDFDVASNPAGVTPFTIALTDDFDGNQMSRVLNLGGGAEIELDVTDLREITVSCQVFVRPTDSTNPAAHARNTMSIAQSSLQLPSFHQNLLDAGISVIERGPIADLSLAIEDTMESRASMDIRCYVVSSAKEFAGFINTTTGTGTVGGAAEGDISVPFDSSTGGP